MHSIAAQPQMNNMFSKLIPRIFKPQFLVGRIVDFIFVGLPYAVDLLGIGGNLFVDKVGRLATELGHTFADASSFFHGISSEFQNIGSLLHGFHQGI